MKNLRLLIILLSCFQIMETKAAKEEPYQSFLGNYGLQIQPNKDYSKYVDKSVLYLGEPTKDFKCEKGKLLTIKKIRTFFDDELSITLIEKDTKKKYEMEVKYSEKIDDLKSIWGGFKKPYIITDRLTVPLLLIDDFNADKPKYEGKEIISESGVKYRITKMSYESDEKKSAVILEYKNEETGKYDNFGGFTEYLSCLGKRYTNPQIKGYYEVIAVYGYSLKEKCPLLRVSYSDENDIKYVWENEAAEKCFEDDIKMTNVAFLTKVEKPENTEERYGNIESFNDTTGKFNFIFKDDIIDISILASNSGFPFILKNISNSSIKLVWNEAAFIDYNGETNRIMHNGIKYNERENDQTASVIIKGAKLEDIIIPNNYVYYKEPEQVGLLNINTADPGGWKVKDLLSRQGQIKLMIPIQIKEVINEYVFEFEVKRVCSKFWRTIDYNK